ncbi:MAG: septum site-determining protein MinC [Geminicoccaceae bacterium]
MSKSVGGLPFQVRGSLQTLLSLKLLRPEDPGFFPALLEKVAHAPDFFRDAPLVLDVAPIQAREPDCLAEIVTWLKEHRVVPVGLQNGSPAWNDAATSLGLAIFAAGGAATTERRQNDRAKPRAGAGTVVSQPVRGGQQVVNPDGDLVVTAAVSPGAEVAAAGHIHIYGPLRGRAFAGMNGDDRAMIFVDQLDAELLSIAGIHLVNEEIDARLLGKRVRASLVGERLELKPQP